jgi:glycosyltransferase involved in cell wall biosynthesis
MKIVLVTELYFPGVSGLITAVRSLAETLSESGHRVTLICPDSWTLKSWAAKHGVALCPVLGLMAPWRIGQRFGVLLPTSYRNIRQVLAKADVVHLHSPLLIGLIVALIARSRGVPIVVTNHALPENIIGALRTIPAFAERILARIIWKWIGIGLRIADVVTSPSVYASQVIRANFADMQVQVISNGIRNQSQESSLEWYDRYRATRVLYVGRLQREKRVDELLHALLACLQAGISIEFTIVGDGPDRQRLEKIAAQLGIVANVTFVGVISDDARDMYLERSCCFWMASRSELQCCAALEAMAAGLPVVAAEAGALAETVPDGVAGLLFPPGEIARIVEIMNVLRRQPDLYRRLSQGALGVAATHSLSSVCETIVQLYSSVLAGRRAISIR